MVMLPRFGRRRLDRGAASNARRGARSSFAAATETRLTVPLEARERTGKRNGGDRDRTHKGTDKGRDRNGLAGGIARRGLKQPARQARSASADGGNGTAANGGGAPYLPDWADQE